MRYCSAIVTVLIALSGFSGESQAHKVNVFAYVDSDAIQVECYFTRSQKVRHGKLIVTDLSTGEKLLEGTTDERGLFRFQPDVAFCETGHGMNIVLNAGEGHQGNWEISPEELASLTPSGQNTGPRRAAQAAPDTVYSQVPGISGATIETVELEALIGKVMDAKLAPIKQRLARQENSGPDLRDIIGGIGWIIGLLGLATYMKYRR
ncbi:MAG: hypothetical protein LBD42_05990 [Desulfovibrio sp.]|jgi:nickel transport protein|nr:hypothetical protein [Desulfovibrio sp.]